MSANEQTIFGVMENVLRCYNDELPAYTFEAIVERVRSGITPKGLTKSCKLTGRSANAWAPTAGSMLACLHIAAKCKEAKTVREILALYEELWPANLTEVLADRKQLIDQLIGLTVPQLRAVYSYTA